MFHSKYNSRFNFICKICKNYFKFKCDLINHMLTHIESILLSNKLRNERKNLQVKHESVARDLKIESDDDNNYTNECFNEDVSSEHEQEDFEQSNKKLTKGDCDGIIREENTFTKSRQQNNKHKPRKRIIKVIENRGKKYINQNSYEISLKCDSKTRVQVDCLEVKIECGIEITKPDFKVESDSAMKRDDSKCGNNDSFQESKDIKDEETVCDRLNDTKEIFNKRRGTMSKRVKSISKSRFNANKLKNLSSVIRREIHEGKRDVKDKKRKALLKKEVSNKLKTTEKRKENIGVKTKKGDFIDSERDKIIDDVSDEQNDPIESKGIMKKNERNEKIFQCPECSYFADAMWKLRKHLVVHKPDKPYSCSLCDYTCKWKNALDKHLLKHSDRRQFACDKCEYKTKFLGDLKSHQTVHTGETITCEVCGKKFKRLSNLYDHQRIHSDARPFACNSCPFRSKDPKTLKTHMLRHSNEKTFGCDQCDYKTASQTYLKKHKRVHVADNAFHCTNCEYTCRSHTTLKRHRLVHKNVEVFSCPHCNYKSVSERAVKRHLRVHSN